MSKSRYAAIIDEIDEISELCESHGQTEICAILDEVTADLNNDSKPASPARGNPRAKELRAIAKSLNKAGQKRKAATALRLAEEMEMEEDVDDDVDDDDAPPAADDDLEDEETDDETEAVLASIRQLERKLAIKMGPEASGTDPYLGADDEDEDDDDEGDEGEAPAEGDALMSELAKLKKELGMDEDDIDTEEEEDEDKEAIPPSIVDPGLPTEAIVEQPGTTAHARSAARNKAERDLRRIASKLAGDGEHGLARRVRSLRKGL